MLFGLSSLASCKLGHGVKKTQKTQKLKPASCQMQGIRPGKLCLNSEGASAFCTIGSNLSIKPWPVLEIHKHAVTHSEGDLLPFLPIPF